MLALLSLFGLSIFAFSVSLVAGMLMASKLSQMIIALALTFSPALFGVALRALEGFVS
jgi:hypothetical protein